MFKNIKHFALPLTCALSVAWTSNAMAGNDPQFTVGLNKGNAGIDSSAGLLSEDADMLGLQFGYDFGNMWAVEGIVSQGDIASLVDLDYKAVHGVFRTTRLFYFMAKAGYGSLTFDSDSFLGDIDDQSGLSGGLGFGFHLGDHGNIELEFTRWTSDAAYVGLSASYGF